MMNSLSSDLRKRLERTIVQARDIAEEGAKAALEALAVHHHEPYGHMSPEQRKLRRRLRAHARHLGDHLNSPLPRGEGSGVRAGAHTIDHLVQECAYEHWHGMLFARFLAENQLLIEPELGVAITLDECEELAKDEGINKWALAARFAHSMLPQVFRPDHPVFEVQLAREYRLKLEGLVEGLPVEVFTATDALGWVYQFWQTKKKEEVNRSEVKIGADELPAVTQLFTEPYMVQFLLHNSLGAWWGSRHPDKSCPIDLTYLRRTEDGAPAAGQFEGWPDDLSEFRLLDPCCGSGHFLVAAFLMLVPMRMALEGLSAREAVDAVLQENLHGLEIDQRCVAIAAFALALEAWRYPGAGGYRPLPRLNLAWCGQPVAGKKDQWLALAEGDERLEAGMAALYDTFRDAPTLGSLIDPKHSVPEDMLRAGFEELQPLLEKALREHVGEEDLEETAIAASGLLLATRLLTRSYHLVTTNVPYLKGGDHGAVLKRFCESLYDRSKYDLATVFIERLMKLLNKPAGTIAIVTQQYWLFLKYYSSMREYFIKNYELGFIARLGAGAFDTISGEVVNVCLQISFNSKPESNYEQSGLELGEYKGLTEKQRQLIRSPVIKRVQLAQLLNPDNRISFELKGESRELLSDIADFGKGSVSGDGPHYLRKFWEFDKLISGMKLWLNSPDSTPSIWSGREHVILWGIPGFNPEQEIGFRYHGQRVFGKRGVAIGKAGRLRFTPYMGELFDDNLAVVCPYNESDLEAVWAFLRSSSFEDEIRKLDKKLSITAGTFTKVPFNPMEWRDVSTGVDIRRPLSDDPTQWIFHGHPCGSVIWDEQKKWTAHGPLRTGATVLQVAVARLLGYHWPAENDLDMELADEQREWVEKAKTLYRFEDEDGIVCIPPVRGERPAAERLLELLHAACGDEWHDDILAKLLAEVDGKTLEDWLRNKLFEQHCKLFHHRPFIWHIWDGRKRDGFHALVNYHRLAEGDGKGRRLLESLTYSYLGDWIARQEDGVKRGEGGAEDRLAAASELQKRLVAILEGEPPFDIFVRWKPIEEQPIGWEPDINDGVRLNIRPFMADDIPGGKKGAGILRAKPNIKWNKDRGKEPTRDQEQFPWFWKDGKFTGERVNDVHLTTEEKRKARKRTEGKK